jgi:hypothetical protein
MTPNRRRASAVATTLVAVGALAACGGNGTSANPGVAAPAPTTAGPRSAAAKPAPASSSPSSPAASKQTMTVAVYYLTDDPQRGPVLTREFRRVPKSAGVVRAAVDAMLHLEPLDPDYSSPWPEAAQVRGVSVKGDTVTVDLTAAATLRVGSTFESAAMQQLVWTVTAAAPKVSKVRVLIEGRTPPSGQQDWSAPQRRQPSYEVLAAVQITQPEHGSKIARSLTISGEATVFEATVSWSVIDVETKRVYAKGFDTASTGAPGRGTWKATTTLPAAAAGRHVQIRAWESSAKDGSVTNLDTKNVQVR